MLIIMVGMLIPTVGVIMIRAKRTVGVIMIPVIMRATMVNMLIIVAGAFVILVSMPIIMVGMLIIMVGPRQVCS